MAAKTKKSSPASKSKLGLESAYFLKLVLYLVVGAQWIRFENHSGGMQVPVPIGFLVGLLFAAHDHFQIDRKIEFAVLLIAMFVGFWSQVGVYIAY